MTTHQPISGINFLISLASRKSLASLHVHPISHLPVHHHQLSLSITNSFASPFQAENLSVPQSFHHTYRLHPTNPTDLMDSLTLNGYFVLVYSFHYFSVSWLNYSYSYNLDNAVCLCVCVWMLTNRNRCTQKQVIRACMRRSAN